MMLSIIIPIYNEEEIIEDSLLKLYDYINSHDVKAEVIIVSNGSNDKSIQIIEAFVSKYENLSLLTLLEKGPGRAFVAGVKVAKNDFIVSLDADLSSDLVFIEYARDLLTYSDMVIGSKTLGRQRRGILRVFGSQLYILLSQLVFGLSGTDYSMGAKAYRKSTILSIVDNLNTWTGYVFELALYMKCHGYKIIQVGIDCEDLRKSHFNLAHEGFFRYFHLFKCYRLLRKKSSWLLV